jgi:WD40 repeat protein
VIAQSVLFMMVSAWTLPTHFVVPSIAFSADGRYLALAGSIGPQMDLCAEPACRGFLHVWDLRRGQRVFAAQNFARVMSLAFAGDSRRVATGHSDGVVRVWQAGDFTPAGTFTCCAGTWIRALAWSPDGAALAVGAQNGQIVLRTAAGDQRVLGGHLFGVSSLVFDRAGEHLLSTADDQHAYRWNLKSGARAEFSRGLNQQKAHRGMVKSVALVGDGDRAVTGAYWEGGTTKDYGGVAPPDQVLRLWNVATAAPIRSYPLEWGIRCCIHAFPNSPRVAYLRARGWDEVPIFEVFNLDSGEVERAIAPARGESFHKAAIDSTQSHVIIDLGDGQYAWFDLASGRLVADLISATEGWAVIAPDGRIEYSDGFRTWPCRNNVQLACAGGAQKASAAGLLSQLLGVAASR